VAVFHNVENTMSILIAALFICLIGLSIAPVLAMPAFMRMLEREGQSRWHAAATLVPYFGLVWILLRLQGAGASSTRRTR
jgi:hypothetical protein